MSATTNSRVSVPRLVAVLGGVVGLMLAITALPAFADTVYVGQSHKGVDSHDNSYSNSDCGGLDPANGAVWHFILNGLEKDTPAQTVVATFEHAGQISGNQTAPGDASTPGTGGQTQHFYIQSATHDVLLDAYAELPGELTGNLVLSHICTSDDTPEPTTTTTEATTATTAPTLPPTTAAPTTLVPATTAPPVTVQGTVDTVAPDVQGDIDPVPTTAAPAPQTVAQVDTLPVTGPGATTIMSIMAGLLMTIGSAFYLTSAEMAGRRTSA